MARRWQVRGVSAGPKCVRPGKKGKVMMRTIRSKHVFVLLLAAGVVRAVPIDEDEARIEALIRNEHAATAAIQAEVRAQAEAQANAPPAPVVAKAIAPPVSELSNDDWLATAATQDVRLTFDQLAQHVGARVTVVTTGERVHRGVVVGVSGHVLTLRVAKAGGGAIYTLKREQIARIDPR
jgi:hypothetical protein